MRLLGPERYRLLFTSADFVSLQHVEPTRFSGLATTKKPKLYIVSVADVPAYVGSTRQKIRDRLRCGWSAKGETGYYGYRWRHEHREIDLDIWLHDDVSATDNSIDIETLEAEIVF